MTGSGDSARTPTPRGGSAAGPAQASTTLATQPAQFCHQCASALSMCGVGLALLGPDSVGVLLAATTRETRLLEELQFTLGDGPCLDASRASLPVLEGDLMLTEPTRWPGFTPVALSMGVRAIFAFPLQVGGIHLGALNMYRGIAGPLHGQELSDAWAFADAATLLLLHMQQHDVDTDLAHPALATALADRAQVHQATGMISVQLGVSLAEALLRLRAHVYATDRLISDVAAAVVSRRLRFDDSQAGTAGPNQP